MATVAAPKRNQKLSLVHEFQTNPKNFEFYRVIDFFERVSNVQQSTNNPSLGQSNDPEREVLSIKSNLTLAVPNSEVEYIDFDRTKPTVYVNFLNLAGRQGPLPTPYVENLIDKARHHDTGFRDFLDIFNHRLASLWYYFRKKYAIGLDQISPKNFSLSHCLQSLAGIPSQEIIGKAPLEIEHIRPSVRLLWPKTRSKLGLKKLLESILNTKVSIEEYQGGWLQAPSSELSYIGHQKGQFQQVGHNMILGSRQWKQSLSFTINIGPISWSNFCQFWPLITGVNNHALNILEMVQFYVGMCNSFKIITHVKNQNVEFLRLDRQYPLGRNSWLKCSTNDTNLTPYHYKKELF